MSLVPAPTDLPQLPPLYRLRVSFPRPREGDVAAAVARELAATGCRVGAGETVAISVGSRGIANLATAVRATVDWVRGQGGEPFLVPAMGSHGGATGPGQQAVIEGYGCTEAAMGCPIRSSMEVVELPQGQAEVPVFLDRHASTADHVIVLNRVKIHTDFHGPYESGLMKMLAIGLGKQAQAVEIHRHGVHGMRDIMPQVAREILAHAPILCGVALLENAYDETMQVSAMAGADIPSRELELIEVARGHMPRLPVDDLDILVVDRIGKNISGVCMDTNIIGRLYVDGVAEPERPRIGKIVARDLTVETHGNALGVGLADIVTRRLANGIDWAPTYENIYTSTFVKRGFLPLVMETDAQAVAFAQRAIRGVPVAEQRIVRIRDTLHLGEVHASAAVVAACADRDDIVVGETIPSWFIDDGSMVPF